MREFPVRGKAATLRPDCPRVKRRGARALLAALPAAFPVAVVALPAAAGTGVVDRADAGAYSAPAPELDAAARVEFLAGRALFRRQWRPGDGEGAGLGPLFNRRSCAGCHVRDGRGRPPQPGARGPARGMVAIFGAHERFGRQLQDQAVVGAAPEGRLSLAWESVTGAFADGERFALRAPRYRIEAAGWRGDEPFSPRAPPAVFGLGLLEAVADEEIERPDSAAPGRAARVDGGVGRFGWRAERARLRDQVIAAAREDIGLDSPAEIDAAAIDSLVAYLRGLAVPARRRVHAPEVRRGAAVFAAVGCPACHRPELRIGPSPPVAAWAGRIVRPYTDLRLHDMGPGLADPGTDSAEWRTPPLWGLGLIETVNGHSALLHDGRARGALEAVLWHGGEAAASRDAVIALNARRRADLLAFLASL